MKYDRNILLIAAVTGLFLALLFAINQEEHGTIEPIAPPQNEKISPRISSNFTVFVPKDVCEGCHMSGKSFIPQAVSVGPHVRGGAYCLVCHKISHEKHPINQNVTCEKCHGASPARPAYINGTISCNNCHGYPDPLLPSGGNIITIHTSRGVSCNTCHTDECTKCHAETGKNERWEKRLAHFRALMKVQ